MEPQPPRLRKRLLAEQTPGPQGPAEIDVPRCAVVAYSSEAELHPVERLFDRCTGRGASRWIAGRSNSTERIIIEFDEPQTISRIAFEIEESEYPRTQEVRIDASADGGQSYRGILVQEYTFSPGGATFESETLDVALDGVTQLRFTIVPNKGGWGTATMTSLRLFRDRLMPAAKTRNGDEERRRSRQD